MKQLISIKFPESMEKHYPNITKKFKEAFYEDLQLLEVDADIYKLRSNNIFHDLENKLRKIHRYVYTGNDVSVDDLNKSDKFENVEPLKLGINRYALVDPKGYEQFVVHLDKVKSNEFAIFGKCFIVNSWLNKKAEFDEEEQFSDFYIKSDGCSHITFGEEQGDHFDSYFHICGIDEYFKFMKGILFMYALADYLLKCSNNDEPYTGPEEVEKWKSLLNGFGILEDDNVVVSL